MLVKTLMIAALALVSQVSAVAVVNSLDERGLPPCKDGKEQQKCVYSEKGNVKMSFGGGKVNCGNVTMKKIVDSIRKHCKYRRACDDRWTIPTFLAPSVHDYLQEGEVIVTPLTTQFTKHSLAPMEDVLGRALTSFVNATSRPDAVPRDTAQTEIDMPAVGYINQFIGPKEVTLTIPGARPGDVQVFAFELKVVDLTENGDFCGSLGTISGAVGGALALDPATAPTGFGLTLFGFLCDIVG